MTRWLPIVALLFSLSKAVGHVGSPNVFFEGPAGPHALRVIVRPPTSLPGIAQVDVRVNDSAVTNVTIQAVLFDAGLDTAPAPTEAVPISGETNAFNGSVWFFQHGSYSVRIGVEGPQGKGIAVVPVASASLRPPQMPLSLRIVLVFSGVLLLVGALWISGAAAHSQSAGLANLGHARDRTRGFKAIGITALLLGTGIYACALRWEKMDQQFRNQALYKPVPVSAVLRTNGNIHLLQLTPATKMELQSSKFEVSGGATADGSWDRLLADHGKLMHLFLLREPGFDTFAHIHPVHRNDRTFENVLPPLPAGHYQLYAEITRENGLSETLIGNVTLPTPIGIPPQLLASNRMNEVFCQSAGWPGALRATGMASQPLALDADDSWHVAPDSVASSTANVSPLMGGWKMFFENKEELTENKEVSLRFALFTAEGQPATLQHYMGMLGHAVVRRSDGSVFIHLHPVGTISMAAQELFARGEERVGSSVVSPSVAQTSLVAHEVAFPYAFPRAGEYRLWVQMRTQGRVLTGVFNADVKRAR